MSKKCVFVFYLLIIFVFSCCKIKISLSESYGNIKNEFEKGNYESVISLLESSNIKKSQKTDWFYYFYGVSLYKIDPQKNVRAAIKQLKIANKFNNTDYQILYYLGQMNFDICDYDSAIKYFKKADFYETEEQKIPNQLYSILWVIQILNKQGQFDKSLSIVNSLNHNKLYEFMRDAFMQNCFFWIFTFLI